MIDLTDLFSDSDDSSDSFVWTKMDDTIEESTNMKVWGWKCQRKIDSKPIATLTIFIDNVLCSVMGTYKTINSFGKFTETSDSLEVENWQNKIDEITNSIKLFKKAVEETSKIITIFNFDE